MRYVLHVTCVARRIAAHIVRTGTADYYRDSQSECASAADYNRDSQSECTFLVPHDAGAGDRPRAAGGAGEEPRSDRPTINYYCYLLYYECAGSAGMFL